MKTVAELRKTLYDYNRKYFSYMFDKWKWYSYRKLKLHLYLNVTSVLVYLFMKLKIAPNIVTVAYATLGILGGIFLAIPIKWFILAGLIMFYFRPFLDWSDGLLARETKRTSLTGDILDNYGAIAGWVPLWTGLGLYVAEKFGDMGWFLSGVSVATIFFCLAPIIPVLFAINLMTSAKGRLYDAYIVKSIRDYIQKEPGQISSLAKTNSGLDIKFSLLKKAINVIDKVFEHNSRTVDLLCLVILLELFLPFFISWVIFLAFLAWQIVFFAASFYMVVRGGWVEKELKDKLEQINKDGPAD
jgi:ABC-type multidrug transport system fused ATPase/permease subunit